MDRRPTTFQHRRPRIHQEKILRRYLDAGGRSAACDGSNFGAQLERLANLGMGAAPCKRCGGSRDSDEPGTGFVVPEHNRARFDAYIKREAEAWAAAGQEIPEHLPPPWRWVIACPRCKGMGWIPRTQRRRRAGPLTARPTGSSKHGAAPHSLGDAGIELVGRVGRWLTAVGTESLLAAESLEAYFGPDGGHLTAVWHLVPAGKTLLRRRQDPNQGTAQFFEAMVREEKDFPEYQRARLMWRADRDAAELLDTACRLWNRVVPDERDDDQSDRKAQDQEIVDEFWREVS